MTVNTYSVPTRVRLGLILLQKKILASKRDRSGSLQVVRFQVCLRISAVSFPFNIRLLGPNLLPTAPGHSHPTLVKTWHLWYLSLSGHVTAMRHSVLQRPPSLQLTIYRDIISRDMLRTLPIYQNTPVPTPVLHVYIADNPDPRPFEPYPFASQITKASAGSTPASGCTTNAESLPGLPSFFHTG